MRLQAGRLHYENEPMPSSVTDPRRPAGWRRRWLRGVVLFVVVPYLSILAMLAAFQRSLIYVPTRESDISPQQAGFATGTAHPINVTTGDGLRLNGWHVLPKGRTAENAGGCDAELARRPLVLFFHGNGGHRGHRDDDYRLLAGLDLNVFAFDYRGYGDNPGDPTEEALAADAHLFWQYATAEKHVRPEQIILFGESIGGGVATRLAAELCRAGTPPAGLILRSTFSSLTDQAAFLYPWLPVRLVLLDRYPSIERIGDVNCPILILHGRLDSIVPYNLGERLFDAAPATSAAGISKRMVELPSANHNDVLATEAPAFRAAVREFLTQITSSLPASK